MPPGRAVGLNPEMPHPRSDDDWFGWTLSDLEQTGCSLLVTGSFAAEVRDLVSARMLGRRPGERARVLGLAGLDLPAARRRLDRVPAGRGPAVLVNTTEMTRSVGVAGTDPGHPYDVRTVGPGLDAFEAELRAAVDEVRRHRGPLAPSALRVGVDSLRTVHEATGRADVEVFVERVGRDVREAGGLVHFVYGTRTAGGRPAWLDPLFDAVVEHRTDGDAVEQRWLFPNRGRGTDWFPLDRPENHQNR